MKVNNSTTLKQAQTDCKNILRAANGYLHYDFEKPFNVYRIAGKFTVKQIEKIVDGFAGKNILLFTIDTCAYSVCDRKDYHVAQIYGGTVNIDFRPYKLKFAHDNFDYYMRKSDFENMRKSNGAITYIIVQDKNAAIIPAAHYSDYTGRVWCNFSKWGTVRRTGDGRGRSWISEVNARDARGNNITYHIHHRDTNDAGQIVDKSGYIVDFYRDKLLHRLQAYKADKRKKEYLQTDNAGKIDSLREKIAGMKEAYKQAFAAADTSDTIRAITGLFDYKYRWIYSDFEKYAQKTREKSYRSIEESEKAYNTILEYINIKMKELNEVQNND